MLGKCQARGEFASYTPLMDTERKRCELAGPIGADRPLVVAVGPEQGVEHATAEQIADILYKMGFRLSNSIYTPLTDTNEEITLSNVYAPSLNRYWADGTNRDTDEIYALLDIPQGAIVGIESVDGHLRPVAPDSIVELLYQKSMNGGPDGSLQDLLGTMDENSFLLNPRTRQVWGDLTCYRALLELGVEDPLKIVPQEMHSKVVEAVLSARRGLPIDIHKYQSVILSDPELAGAVALVLVGNVHMYEGYGVYRLFEELCGMEEGIERVVSFLKSVAQKYPGVQEGIKRKFLTDPRLETFSFRRWSVYKLALFGEDFYQQAAEASFPERHSDFNYHWLSYNIMLHNDQSLRPDKDGNLVSATGLIIPPPVKVFRQLQWNGEPGGLGFATPENSANERETLERGIERLKEKIDLMKKKVAEVEGIESGYGQRN